MIDKKNQILIKHQELMDKKASPMLLIDQSNGDIIYSNIAAQKYYLYSKKEFKNLNIIDICRLSETELEKIVTETKKLGINYFTNKHYLANGEVRNVEVYATFIKLDSESIISISVYDQSALKELELGYKKKISQFDAFFKNSKFPIAVIDEKGTFLNINSKFEETFQYSAKELIEIESLEIIVPKVIVKDYNHYYNLIQNGESVNYESRRMRKDGVEIDVLVLGFPYNVENEAKGSFFIYSDLSESITQREVIKKLKYYDQETGLFNRQHFEENLKYAIQMVEDKAEMSRIAVVHLTLNEYKEINGALGLHYATELVKLFAARINAVLKDSKTLTRISEDEFAIMFVNVLGRFELRMMGDKIFECLKEPFTVNDLDFSITTNIGSSIYPDDSTQHLDLIRQAEMALDLSKNVTATSTVQYEPSLERIIQESFWVKNDLAYALERNEFKLDYQPIYDARDNTVVGAEVLLRWHHSKRGLIGPRDFIPIAEDSGLIIPIGDWVLKQACLQGVMWKNLGYKPIHISVNISLVQIETYNFVTNVKRILKETGFDPNFLQLEITETIFNDDYREIRDSIKQLAEIGVKFAIDDFGTGYSSLYQLIDLEISNLKIDRTFVDEVDKHPNKAKIVMATISLATSLGMGIIAEGAERIEEVSFLQANNTNIIQGYYFSRPIENKEFEKLIRLK